MALKRCATPIYIATARIFDDEFRKRVEVHQARRGREWTTLEEPLEVGKLEISGASTVLLDCLTLLTTNWFFECGENIDDALENLKHELDILFEKDADFIVVTNEIGMGGISSNELQRRFADLQGFVNQYVAAKADEVYLTVAGLPVKIK